MTRISILYEDSWMVAVHKPAGILTHPDPTSRSKHSLLRLVRNHVGSYVYPIHRLDRATSGLLLFAKSSSFAGLMGQQFQERSVEKDYLALTRGWCKDSLVDSSLEGKSAITNFYCLAKASWEQPLGDYPEARFSLVLAQPKTGYQHQIRRHLKRLAHPIVGDTKYGDGRLNRYVREHFGSRRLHLYAYSLRFNHPQTCKDVTLYCPPPGKFAGLLSYLKLISEEQLQKLFMPKELC